MTRVRFGWQVYRLVRPVVRPALWRLRTFLVGPLHDEIRALQRQVASLEQTIAADRQATATASDVRARDTLADALATLALDADRD